MQGYLLSDGLHAHPAAIADGEYKWILQMKDHFTKMVWLQPPKDKTALAVSVELEKWMDEHGEPRKL